MLGGIDPIIIIQLAKNIDPTFVGPEQPGILSRIPVVSQIPTVVDQPPIPIYLSENLTGIFVDSEDKNVDIQTSVETLSNGEEPDVNQKGIGSTVTINLIAKKDSIAMSLLSGLMDQVFEKLSSKEYAISYLHGPVTIFRALLQSYQVSQVADTDILNIRIELTKGAKTPVKAPALEAVPGFQGTLPGA